MTCKDLTAYRTAAGYIAALTQERDCLRAALCVSPVSDTERHRHDSRLADIDRRISELTVHRERIYRFVTERAPADDKLVATAMYWHFIQGESWRRAGLRIGSTAAGCRMMVKRYLQAFDNLGF